MYNVILGLKFATLFDFGNAKLERKLNFVKKFMIYGMIFIVAITSGMVIGDIYVNSKTPTTDTSSLSEELLRGDQEEIEALYNDALSGRKRSFSAVELYQIAEYKLQNTSRYVKVLSGLVDTTIKQNMLSNKIVTENGITYLKMSPSGGNIMGVSAPTIAAKIQYNYSSPDEVLINSHGTITGDSIENYEMTLDERYNEVWTTEKYKEEFNTDVTTPLAYIISNITCAEGNYDKNVTLGSDGNYNFKIKVSGNYAIYAALYYRYEVSYFSGYAMLDGKRNLPAFSEVEFDVVVDSDFNFVRIDYVEKYVLKTGIIDANVTDYFSDVFYYDEDTIASYLQKV